MSKLKLSDHDVKLLNSKVGMKRLMEYESFDIKEVLENVKFDNQLIDLQVELVKLQNWVIHNNEKVAIIFEGRDAAGKGGAIRTITEHINPRHYRSVALPKPSEEEKGSWYFQRYVYELPSPGQMVFFDRSWYNRAVVEPVNGFCTTEEYHRFMKQVNPFEKMLRDSGIYFMKFYYSIDKEEQARRFNLIKSSPLTKWKLSPIDERAQKLWDKYTRYKEKMFKRTSTKLSPWHIIDANHTYKARIQTIKEILNYIPYS